MKRISPPQDSRVNPPQDQRISPPKHQTAPLPRRSWPLGQAKARFSEVVRLARAGRPQSVTVHGKDAVVIVATPEFERLLARGASPTVHELLSGSPLNFAERTAASGRRFREVDE